MTSYLVLFKEWLAKLDKVYATPRLHRHDGYPMHDVNIFHNNNRKVRNEDKVMKPEDLDVDM